MGVLGTGTVDAILYFLFPHLVLSARLHWLVDSQLRIRRLRVPAFSLNLGEISKDYVDRLVNPKPYGRTSTI